MAEYLNKQTALDAILAEYPDAHYPEWYAAKIKALPAADVAPVVQGDGSTNTGTEEVFEHTKSVMNLEKSIVSE